MVNLKNYRVGIKIEEERGKNGEEKRIGYRRRINKLIYACSVFLWRIHRDALKTTLKRYFWHFESPTCIVLRCWSWHANDCTHVNVFF